MNNLNILKELTDTIEQRKSSSKSESYVSYLFSKGQDAILKKVIEEAGEVVMASKDNDLEHIIKEVADLLFHSMILLSYHGLTIEKVLEILQTRQKKSGLEEKASRNK